MKFQRPPTPKQNSYLGLLKQRKVLLHKTVPPNHGASLAALHREAKVLLGPSLDPCSVRSSSRAQGKYEVLQRNVKGFISPKPERGFRIKLVPLDPKFAEPIIVLSRTNNDSRERAFPENSGSKPLEGLLSCIQKTKINRTTKPSFETLPAAAAVIERAGADLQAEQLPPLKYGENKPPKARKESNIKVTEIIIKRTRMGGIFPSQSTIKIAQTFYQRKLPRNNETREMKPKYSNLFMKTPPKLKEKPKREDSSPKSPLKPWSTTDSPLNVDSI